MVVHSDSYACYIRQLLQKGTSEQKVITSKLDPWSFLYLHTFSLAVEEGLHRQNVLHVSDLVLLAESPPFGWVPSLSIERVFFKCLQLI